MKKATLLKAVNAGVAVLFLTLAATGAGSSFLPAGSAELHQYAGYLFTVFAAFHVVLNWAWIKSNVLKKTSSRSIS